MNVKTKAAIGIVLALVIGFFLFGGTSQAVTPKSDCTVVNVQVVEEPLKRLSDGKIFGYRYVRTDTVRCGPSKYTDIVTYGKYTENRVFRSHR